MDPWACVDGLLSAFAADIITHTASRLELSDKQRKELAKAVPGLLHSHAYRADDPVPGCVYCTRLQERKF